ncbi:MAG: hypothetical protein HC880_15200 [Bacteroidia bacterium]|nr:hypothetical protein [Bacteroidia bacterium]
MKRKIRLRHRLQYWFDNLMTGGIIPIIVILLILAGMLTLFITFVLLIAHIHLQGEIEETPSEVFWQTFMHLIDQGTITGDEGVSWLFRFLMLVPTAVGILLVATWWV